MIKAGIVGATGYTGVELVRLLLAHPQIELAAVTSRSDAGQRLDQLFPNLRGHCDLVFEAPDVKQLSRCDVVFFATPHGVAHSMAAELLAAGPRIIDLSADFRLRDAALWEQWYQQPHGAPQLLSKAVYGLPEIHREQIAGAELIAVPGCYPTAITLGFLPLLERGLVDTDHLIADAKSGVSGAGRKASVGSLLCEAGENFKAYGVAGHRHLPEILQTLNQLAGQPTQLSFVPHLLPMIRGILATLYARISDGSADLQVIYEQRYAAEPFVDVMPAGGLPETRSVRGSNLCRIAVHQPLDGETVVVLSAIDNLVKGASGQAVQNLNIMFGLPETMGLQSISSLP